MRAISTTLTLVILLLPLTLLSTVFLVAILWFRGQLDFSITITTFSTFLSAILVNLLVWERLRQSLSDKMDFLHEEIILKLFLGFTESEYRMLPSYKGIRDPKSVKMLKDDWEKYGRFLGIRLYPHQLLERIDDYVSYFENRNSKLARIYEMAKRLNNLDNTFYILHYLGLEPNVPSSSSDEDKKYKDFVSSFERDEKKLLDETRVLYEEIEKKRKVICSEFERFLKQNSLRLEPKPVQVVTQHPV